MTRSRDGCSVRSPSWTVSLQMQSFCWSEAAVVGNLTKPGSGRSPSWCLPSGYFLRAFMDLAGKGQDDLGRICVRYTCYMTKQGTDRPLTLEILDWRQLERLRCGWSLTTWCRVFGVGSACGMLQVCATRRMSASTSRSHTVTPTYTTAVNPKFRGIADMSITPNPT